MTQSCYTDFEPLFEICVEARQALKERVQDNIANKVIIFNFFLIRNVTSLV